jgi:hypothetical protein
MFEVPKKIQYFFSTLDLFSLALPFEDNLGNFLRENIARFLL